MSKKIKSLLLASLTIMLCVAMIVGGTYALYTSKTTFVHHLQAGNMNVTLTRLSLTTTKLNDAGELITSKPNTTKTDFTNATNANVFGLADGEVIVPLSSYTAEMEVANKSNVGFVYWLEISVPQSQKDDQDLVLDDQMQVTITVDGGQPYVCKLSDGMVIGSASAPVATVLKTTTSNFTVTVEFLDDKNNNNAMFDEVYFDLIVHAQQVTPRAEN